MTKELEVRLKMITSQLATLSDQLDEVIEALDASGEGAGKRAQKQIEEQCDALAEAQDSITDAIHCIEDTQED
jgi:ElaB/YqjD/DUF883 family membrane-anchored ribosome-binding protein